MKITQVYAKLFIALIIPLLLSACAKSTTEGIKTSFMEFYGTVESNPDETTVSVDAWLTSEEVSGPYQELGDGESLTVSNGVDTVTLKQDSGIQSDHKFKGTIDYIDGATYTIAYNRTSDVSASNSTVDLSSELTITSPTADHTYTDGEVVDIEWTIPTDYANFYVTSAVTCKINNRDDQTSSQTITDDNSGSISITIEKLLGVDLEQFIITQCDIDIDFVTMIEGVLDPTFGGGSMGAKSRRRVSVVYIPQ